MEAAEPIVRRRRERQFRTTEEKRLIVEATRRAGVSVAAVAQAHGVNANQVFYWRKLYAAGQLECKPLLARTSRHLAFACCRSPLMPSSHSNSFESASQTSVHAAVLLKVRSS